MSAAVPVAARRAAEALGALGAVEAVALGGSHATGLADAGSDVDLYVFASRPLPLADRHRPLDALSDGPPVRIVQWGDDDAWIDLDTGVSVEAMHWTTGWVEGELDRVLRRHEPRLGYSTSIWHTVRVARPLFDRTGWLASVQEDAARPYPPGLQRSVIEHNRPPLRDLPASYRHQIASAARRGDRVSLNHRAAAFLASAFDCLFAANAVPHPGEKRQMDHAERLCPHRPPTLRADVVAFLEAAATGDGATDAVDRIADGLDGVLDALDLLSLSPTH